MTTTEFRARTLYLVDSDPVNLLVFKYLINRFDQHLKVMEINCGRKALDQLIFREMEKENLMPDYLFLATQTPTMTCWQFLKAFEQLRLKGQENILIYILSPLLPDDVIQNNAEKLKYRHLVAGYINHGINPQLIEEIFRVDRLP